jgi:hypothetical protein
VNGSKPTVSAAGGPNFMPVFLFVSYKKVRYYAKVAGLPPLRHSP